MSAKGKNKENLARKKRKSESAHGPNKKPRSSSPVADSSDVSDEEEGGAEAERTIPKETARIAIKAVFASWGEAFGKAAQSVIMWGPRFTFKASASPEVLRAKDQLDHAYNVDAAGNVTEATKTDFNWLSDLFRGFVTPLYISLGYFCLARDGLIERAGSHSSRMLPRYIWTRFEYFGKTITMLEAKFHILIRDDDRHSLPTLRSAFESAWASKMCFLDIEHVIKESMSAENTKEFGLYAHILRFTNAIMHYVGSAINFRARQLGHMREGVSRKYRHFAWIGDSIRKQITRPIIYIPSHPIFSDRNDGYIWEGIIIRATGACGPDGLNTNEEDSVHACIPLVTLTMLWILAWIRGELDFLRGGMTYPSWGFSTEHSFWAKQFPRVAIDMAPSGIAMFLRAVHTTPYRHAVRCILLEVIGPIRGLPGTAGIEFPHPANRFAELLREVGDLLPPSFLEVFEKIAACENIPDVDVKTGAVLHAFPWDELLPDLHDHGVNHANPLIASTAKNSITASAALKQGLIPPKPSGPRPRF